MQNTDNEKVAEITFDSGICQNFHVTVLGQEMQQDDYKHAVKLFRMNGFFLFVGLIYLFCIPDDGIQGILGGILYFVMCPILVIGFLGFIWGIFQMRKIRKKILCGIHVEITGKYGISPIAEGYCASFLAKDVYNGYEIKFTTFDINAYQEFEVGDRVTLTDYISVKNLKKYGIEYREG